MFALLSFLAVIVLVVAVHEWGHYAAARFFGVRVLRFSVGFGSPLLKKTDAAGTEWVLAPIPLGGYVRLLDKHAAAELGIDAGRTMEAQNNWRRFVIYAAGPLANLVLSAVILTGVFMSGEVGLAARIGAVDEGSPAARAGLSAGETIESVNGAPAPLWSFAAAELVDAALSGDAAEVQTDRGVYEIPAGAATPADIESNLWRALGMHPDSGFKTQIVSVVIANSPAAAAGIRPGDVIAAVDDVVPESWRELEEAIRARPGRAVSLILWRDGEAVSASARLESSADGGRNIGRLGIVPWIDRERLRELLATVRLSPGEAMARATAKTAGDMARTFLFLRHIAGGNLSFEKNISGPVGIAKGAGSAADAGWTVWWSFVAVISVSLAAINLLPLPVLDGGQMLICVVQAVMRRPLPEKLAARIDRAGVALLLVLMAAAIVSDLSKLF
ncbi:MAG: RIP metalloprotease RseP [Gammaproteobacteria bacterium]